MQAPTLVHDHYSIALSLSRETDRQKLVEFNSKKIIRPIPVATEILINVAIYIYIERIRFQLINK